MKQFVFGIVATVISGFVLFWLTSWYGDQARSARFNVEFETYPAAAFIGTPELDAFLIMAKSEDSNEGKVGLVSIRNTSSEDIRNAKFLIAPTESNFDKDNLYGFGLGSFIDGSMPEPKLSIVDGGISVNFPILKKNNGAYFWILHQAPQGFTVLSDSEELRASEKDVNSDVYDIGFILLIGISCLLIGGFLTNQINNDLLRKAGYDPKLIMAQYYRSVAEEEEIKANIKKNGDAK